MYYDADSVEKVCTEASTEELKDEGTTDSREEGGVETWEELESWEDLDDGDDGDEKVDLSYSRQ